jgi:hypothetical protein
MSLAKEVIQTDLPRWVEAKARGADFGGMRVSIVSLSVAQSVSHEHIRSCTFD